jgi:hypothetical protein
VSAGRLGGAERGAQFALGAIFAAAGALKWADPRALADGIHAYRILPPALIDPLALGLPVLEIVLGVCLAAGWRARRAALGILLLSLVFLAALLQARLRRLDLQCACFGPMSAWEAAIPPLPRDAALALLAAWLWVRAARREMHGVAGRNPS